MSPVAHEAKFMGAVTALTMHEMQNILAIIRESAGLLGDVLKINAHVDFEHRSKMEQSLEHITSQIQRGKNLLEATSRLAHSPDDDLLLTCDLNIYARTVALLAERLVRLKGASVHFQPAPTALPVSVGALTVLMAGYRAVQWAVGPELLADQVQLSLQKGDQEHGLVIRPPQDSCPDFKLLDTAGLALPTQNIRTHWDDDQLILFFPAQQDGQA